MKILLIFGLLHRKELLKIEKEEKIVSVVLLYGKEIQSFEKGIKSNVN